jgi:aspartyl-tRNA synthetase
MQQREPDYAVLGTLLRNAVCGQLRSADIGRRVTVCGWVAHRREHGEHLAFVDLRDTTGLIQCVVDGSVDVRNEWVLRVTGTVSERPDGTVNDGLLTGEIELHDCEVEVLSRAEPPPFPISDRIDADETVRLRYRYLDLRRERMQRNLRIRSTMNAALRTTMEAMGFAEVETPMLMASSPEGSREFLVPSRLKPGNFYALPQSPQLFKQMLMVGGFDRYYQIARCLRDEDLRADRQFEFTQLDVEASFVAQEDIFGVISEAVLSACEAVTGERPVQDIPRMTWTEAMDRFGSDKPDTRFGMELVEVTDIFAETQANVFKAPTVKALCCEGGADLGRSRIDSLTDLAKQWGAKGLAWAKVATLAEGSIKPVLEQGIAKLLSEAEVDQLIQRTGARPGDILFLVADELQKVRDVLGLLRLELGRPPITEGGLNFLWIIDFPMFTEIDDEGRPVPGHHPFTMPNEDDLSFLEAEPMRVRSQSYDLTCNGWELGSGSIRIHRADIQERIFSLLGIDKETAHNKFGFLLDAFTYGAPPHGGFAVGLDRLAALLAGEENIREVIAYPKTQSGQDPLTNAPTEISPKQMAELGIAKSTKSEKK